MKSSDAFLYAHNDHHLITNNPGNFRDSMEGRIRLVAAFTPTYAHAYQSLCLAGRLFVVHHQKFRLLAVKHKYPNLTPEQQREKKGQGWAVSTDEGTHFAEGVTSAGWRAVARSLHVGGSFSAKVPKSSAEVRKYASWKLKLSGSRNSRVIREKK